MEVLFQSGAEREAALAQILAGESVSNYLRRVGFDLPPLQHRGTRMKAEIISETVLQMCEEKGGQWAALARNYRAAKSNAHRQKIADAILGNATPTMWLAKYQE